MLLMSDLKSQRGLPKNLMHGLLVAGLLSTATLVTLGCAQAESRNWAQTSPLIEPDERAAAGYHLSAHDDAIHADDEDDWYDSARIDENN